MSYNQKPGFTYIDTLRKKINSLHRQNDDLFRKNDDLYMKINDLNDQLKYQKKLVDFFIQTSKFYESLNANNQMYINRLHDSMSNNIPMNIHANINKDMLYEYERFACVNKDLCEQQKQFEDNFKRS